MIHPERGRDLRFPRIPCGASMTRSSHLDKPVYSSKKVELWDRFYQMAIWVHYRNRNRVSDEPWPRVPGKVMNVNASLNKSVTCAAFTSCCWTFYRLINRCRFWSLTSRWTLISDGEGRSHEHTHTDTHIRKHTHTQTHTQTHTRGFQRLGSVFSAIIPHNNLWKCLKVKIE